MISLVTVGLHLSQGLTKYNNKVAVINESVFQPSHLTEDRMIYFWISG